MSDALLVVEDLRVEIPTRRGTVHAVRGVSFRVRSGEMFSVTIDPQMIAVSTAPARAKTALVDGEVPLHAAEATVAR